MSESQVELKTATALVGDENDYARPSPFFLLLMQKLAVAVRTEDSSTIDWDEISSMMSEATPDVYKMIYAWLKQTHADKIPLVFRGCEIPTLSVTSSSSLESTEDLEVTQETTQDPTQEPTQESGNEPSTSASKVPSVTSVAGVSSTTSVNALSADLEGQTSMSTFSSGGFEPELDFFSNTSLSTWRASSSEYLTASPFSEDSLNVTRGVSSPGSFSTVSASSPIPERMVHVLVKDAGKNVEKTFDCTCSMLATYMPFFEERFREVAPEGDVEISIHVDLTVFEKLMDYVNQAKGGDEQNYKIDPEYAIHLLVAADFLYMTPLVEKCIDYCHRHLSAIAQANSPLGAMTDALIQRLAACFNHRELEAVQDPKDRIKGKLYKKLLDKLLIPDDESPGQPGTPKLFRCTMCEQIFATKLEFFIPCKHKKRALGPHGQLVYYHKRDTNWSIDQYLEEQLEAAGSWRRVYWRVWGLVSRLYCITCMLEFCCADFTRCRYHKQPLQFPPTGGEQSSLHQLGTFPCCGRTSYRFDPIDPLHVSYGCSYKNHTVSPYNRPGNTFQDMLTYYDLIYQPRPVELNSFEFSGLQRIVPIFSEKVVSDWSILLGCGRLYKPRKATPKRTGLGEVIPDPPYTGYEPPVSLLSTLTVPSKAFNIKPAWKMRTTHWHNQDVIRDHDNALMERLMAALQKLQPPRTRHSSRK